MVKSLLMSAAYGWFAGLLVIMIVVTALFGFIMFIALRPIKKDELDESSPAKKLQRREAELTVQLLNKQNDKKSQEELIGKLHEVKTAENILNEIMEEEKRDEPVKPAKKPKTAPSAAVKKEQPKKEVKPSAENKEKKN